MTTATKTVTLHCKAGDHDWERPSKRGRQPQNCPEHSESAPVRKPSSITAMQEGRARKVEANRREAIEAVINHPRAQQCRCDITPDMTDEELGKMQGCAAPWFVCATLDSVRRAIGI